MIIGVFKDIVFETSSSVIRTFEGFTRTRSATFAEHAVIDDKPRLQHTGSGLDTITFSVRFDIGLGIAPQKELDKLGDVLASGEAYALIIGPSVLGDFVITDVEEEWSRIDNKGNVLVAIVNVSLKEFV